MMTPISKFKTTLSGFGKDQRGNIAMMFGLLIVPLVIAGGMAIDTLRASVVRTTIQEAADGAILAVANIKSRKPNLTQSEMDALARKYFDHGVENLGPLNIDGFDVTFDPATEAFELQLTGTMDTALMRIAGIDTMALDTLSAVQLGKPPYIELVLALDNTGSMNDEGKLGDLKDAAEMLVESLFEHPDAEVKVGLVPFAQYVNVGEEHASASWLDGPGASWKGCVGSRNYPANVEDSGYLSDPVPALDGAPCPEKILPLSEDKGDILDAIDDMSAKGWTYIPSGLMWAWRALSPQAPFSEGVTFAELNNINGIKSIVLMTDGANTRAPSYPEHDSADKSLANTLTERVCDDVKDEEIVVYTIAFKVTDPEIRSIMQDCATTAGHYFNADDGEALTAAFDAIGASLRNLSLSK